MAERDETFLARWSRRKQAARDAAPQPEPERTKRQDPAPDQGAGAPDRTHETARPDLPDPATLDASSDFSAFLGRDVPVETHRAALRRLWRLDPIYNRLDGLDDYCEDFTDRATVVKGLRTAYRVGRGFLQQGSETGAKENQAPPEPAAPAEDEPAQRIAEAADPTAPKPSEPESPPGARRTGTRRSPAAKS